MTRYLRAEKVSVDAIVRELFDLTRIGVVAVTDFLTVEGRTELLDAVKTIEPLLETVLRVRGPVIQEMRTLYVETRQEDTLPPLFREGIEQLKREYTVIYERIAEAARFQEREFNSLGVHCYWEGSCGITPHQDFTRDHNLVTSFVLSGNAPFYAARTREKEGAQKFDTPPGSLILMRAARDEYEQAVRPFHYLEGPLEEERHSILIRTKRD